MTRTKYNKTVSDLGFTSAAPMPSRDELEQFYADTYYQQSTAKTYSATYSEDELAQKRLRAQLTLHALKDAGRFDDLNGLRFLETGCGEGFIMKAAADAGCQVTGIDYSEYAMQSFHPELVSNLVRGDGTAVLDGFAAKNSTFDICVLQNVIEHVIDPLALLRQTDSIMSDAGVLLINVPNDYSAMQMYLLEQGRIDREHWFSPPDHLHYFNTDTIGNLADAAGYQVLEMFGDFPIELFLFHPGSNYVSDPRQGADAHRARVELDLLLAERGMDAYYDFCRAMSRCGIGRSVCAILSAR